MLPSYGFYRTIAQTLNSSAYEEVELRPSVSRNQNMDVDTMKRLIMRMILDNCGTSTKFVFTICTIVREICGPRGTIVNCRHRKTSLQGLVQ